MKDMLARMVCTIQKEQCFNGLCDDCPMEKITDILTRNNVIDLDDECSWTLWKKVNNKFDLQQIIGSIHTYCTRQQRDHIKQLRSQSTDKTFVVAQIDFSMNYTLIRQREV
jgi:hypothetical protein